MPRNPANLKFPLQVIPVATSGPMVYMEACFPWRLDIATSKDGLRCQAIGTSLLRRFGNIGELISALATITLTGLWFPQSDLGYWDHQICGGRGGRRGEGVRGWKEPEKSRRRPMLTHSKEEPKTMKVCSCGKPLDSSAQHCPACGKSLTPPYAVIFGVGLPILGLVLIIYSCTR